MLLSVVIAVTLVSRVTYMCVVILV